MQKRGTNAMELKTNCKPNWYSLYQTTKRYLRIAKSNPLVKRFPEAKQQFETASIVFDLDFGMGNLTLEVKKSIRLEWGSLQWTQVQKQGMGLAPGLPSNLLISGVVLNFAVKASIDTAPSLYRIFSMKSELAILSPLTSSVSLKIKAGSCSRLSRLGFLTGANGNARISYCSRS